MKMLETKCPNCGANMNYDPEKKTAKCEFCGASLLVDDETHNLRLNNGEEFGDQFEKGRQRAQAESQPSRSYAAVGNSTPQVPAKPKRKTWLWVLGWIFIFPVPLTIILINKPNIDKKLRYGLIIGAWVVYAALAVAGMVSNSGKPKTVKTSPYQTQETTKAPKQTQPTTAVSTTAEPTTEKPTQRETKAATPIVFTEYTDSVVAGSNAFVTIQGAPNTEYDISVHYSSGASDAAGLENKTSDANGFVTWEWEVGPNTTKGEHTITVSGGGSKESVVFSVI